MIVIALLALLSANAFAGSKPQKESINDKTLNGKMADNTDWVSYEQYITEAIEKKLKGTPIKFKNLTEISFKRLLKKIEEQDSNFVNLGFKYVLLADGATAEVLCTSLGVVSEKNAELFLKNAEYLYNTLLAHNEKKWFYDILSSILTSLGPDYVDMFKEQQKILYKRVESLRAYKGKDYKSIQNISIAILNKGISSLEQAILYSE